MNQETITIDTFLNIIHANKYDEAGEANYLQICWWNGWFEKFLHGITLAPASFAYDLTRCRDAWERNSYTMYGHLQLWDVLNGILIGEYYVKGKYEDG